MNLLNTLFSPTVLPDEKKKVLSEKYNIAMTAELESEVQRMCNLSTAIENRGVDKGVDLMAKLMKILLAEKRYSDAERASDDSEYRDQLLKEATEIFCPLAHCVESYMVRWWDSFFASSRMNHRQHPV